MESKIAIALPAFNRLDFLKEVLLHLRQCEAKERMLLVTSEEPDQGSGVHSLLQSIDWIEVKRHVNPRILKSVYNVPNAINLAFHYSDKVIVLEDDVVPARDMLLYFEALLKKFEKANPIVSISAYNKTVMKPEVEKINHIHESPSFTRWGWATWKDRWNSFIPDFSPRSTSWAIEFNLFRQKHGMMEIKPEISRCNNIGSRGVHVTSPSWQKIYQTTSHTSDSYSLNYPLEFQLSEFSYSAERDLIHYHDEVYFRGEYLEAQEFESRFFKKICSGKGAKISASINQSPYSSLSRFDNSIDFPFIGFQEKEYGPFKNKFPLQSFLVTPPSEPLDFIFIENILEYCYNPVEFLALLLKRLKRMGLLFLEIPHPYMKFGTYKPLIQNSAEKPASGGNNPFCFEKNINFWIPETFNAMLKSMSTDLQILYVNKINERKKDKFITVVQKI